MKFLSRDEICRMTAPERLALISQLWDSLENEQVPLSSTQKEELDWRLAVLETDPQTGVSWAALKAELEHRCP
jgi:putative addiction module component (TIGR02574 family)